MPNDNWSGEQAPDIDDRPSGWVNVKATQHLGGKSWEAVRLAAPPPPAEESWARPRRYKGEPTRIVGLVSEVSVDGWDLQVNEVRIFPRELADELIKKRHALLLSPDK